MSEIRIKCPTCGKVLRLNDVPEIAAATFICPNCGQKHVVGDCQRYGPTPLPDVDGTRYDAALAGVEGAAVGTLSPAEVGRLVDACGAEYGLCVGLNTIGRKASTSEAEVQIATNDRTMSRNHAVIEVRSVGAGVQHILSNGKNKNPSYLNGMLIGAGDRLVLSNGDSIKMGETVLTFKK